MLTITGLRKAYDGERVLDGLDLGVEEGEAVALLGSNGSGKTTTLRCVAGLTRPDAGEIRIAGVDAVADGARARRFLAYMPQKSAFPSTLRVRETLAVVARLRGVDPARAAAEGEACGLGASLERYVGALSGGQRQRLALALTLMADVPLYVFDEPSANLDDATLAIFLKRARALVGDGRAVLFTTHSRDDVHALATRVVRIEHGRQGGRPHLSLVVGQ
jgi:ABC-type multidrug transport system ATPase subunit